MIDEPQKSKQRRGFLKGIAIAIIGARSTRAKLVSEEDELRYILFNSPHLFKFSAARGCTARVWLNGAECSYVTEFVGSPDYGKSVRGAVCRLKRDKKSEDFVLDAAGECATYWKVGAVKWMPREMAYVK
jgi:hypothetical protein